MDRYGLYAVEVDDVLMPAISDQEIQTQTEIGGEPLSDDLFRRIQFILSQRPMATWTTRAIGTALGQIGLLGLSIATLDDGLRLYAQKHAHGGTRVADENRRYTFRDGLIVPQSLTADHRGDAELGYRLLATYDGTNAILSFADDVTLPTGLTDAQRYTLGPVSLGGVALEGIRRVEIDFGITADPEGADSMVYDTFVSIVTVQPTLTIRGVTPSWLAAANIPLAGKAGTHANTIFYLRKRAAGGTYVANNVAEHIKFTGAGLAYVETAFNARTGQAGETSLRMPLHFDGTNHPITINTASAIT